MHETCEFIAAGISGSPTSVERAPKEVVGGSSVGKVARKDRFVSKSASVEAKPKFDRTAYQREYMKKWRKARAK